jgi:hypothetical protein
MADRNRRQDKAGLVNMLIDGVRVYNDTVAGQTQSQPLSAFAWDECELVGGVAGRTIYGHFLIQVIGVLSERRMRDRRKSRGFPAGA